MHNNAEKTFINTSKKLYLFAMAPLTICRQPLRSAQALESCIHHSCARCMQIRRKQRATSKQSSKQKKLTSKRRNKQTNIKKLVREQDSNFIERYVWTLKFRWGVQWGKNTVRHGKNLWECACVWIASRAGLASLACALRSHGGWAQTQNNIITT